MEWIDIEEDLPLKDPNYKRLSLSIDILMNDGAIYRNGVMTIDTEEFYTDNSKHLKYENVKAWRSSN